MDAEKKQPTISIITATLNVAHVLPRLIDSLAAQTDQDFEWVVADGGSTDGTLELLEEAKSRLKSVIVDSRPDFGIYDAMNRAVKMARGEYYIVMGADDEFFPDAVEKYRKACAESGADLVTARYYAGNKIAKIRWPRWEALFGPFAYVTGHAVGLAIKRSLHDYLGFYSNRYPICADQLFIFSVIRNKGIVYKIDETVGIYSLAGTSSNNFPDSLFESFCINIKNNKYIFFKTIILILRIIKNFKKMSS